MTKPKNNSKISARDQFQTPVYAVDLLIPHIPKHINTIWECACGQYFMTLALRNHGYDVYPSDIINGLDFLECYPPVDHIEAIITNPPYSQKLEFYKKCREYDLPFALLIPADYCGWIIQAIQDGCEKIIPTRRIDFITPTGKSGETGQTSYYHSMWLTWKFNLGQTETFVNLTIDQKKNIYKENKND